MKNLNIAYIGGGSRAWARNLMNDLALEKSLCGTVRLYDIDFSAALMNEKIGNLYKKAEGALSAWDYEAVPVLDDALKDADFVVISILPGTFDDMENDVHYPEKYGICQSVGDTVGPGGIMRAVRAIPMYVEIAEKINKICPAAIVITYTNPMTVLTKTLFSIFPAIKAFGCCHEVFGTKSLLATMLADAGIADGVGKEDISTNVLGINHFTWLDKAQYKGDDIFPYYRKFVDKYFDSGYCLKGKWSDDWFSSGNKVKFDLFREYGLIAAAGDRHLAEFCPDRYLKTNETAKHWQFSLTPVSWRKADLQKRCKKTEDLLSGVEKPLLRNTGEEGVALIKALAGGGSVISNVNTINFRQHEGIPEGAVVETNAVFSKGEINPVASGRLPRDIEVLVLRHVYNQEALVKACIKRDLEGVFRVFINDPLVHLPKGTARKLFDEMFEKNLKYWA